MEMTMTNGFMELDQNECMKVDGGIVPLIIAIVAAAAATTGTGVAIYQCAKDDAYNRGKADAYRDLGYLK